MFVRDLFATLSYGELSNLSMGLDGAGDIAPDEQAKVLMYANQVLTQIYSRFSHKTDYVKLALDPTINKYYLRNVHAVSNVDAGNTLTRYIQDTVDAPFETELIKILEVTWLAAAEDECDKILTINDRSDENTIKTLSFDTIYIKEPEEDRVYLAEIQVNHPKLLLDGEIYDQFIELAPMLHEALEVRIAARIFQSIGGEENQIRSNSLNKRYEEICLRAENGDMLQTSSSDDHNRLTLGGFR